MSGETSLKAYRSSLPKGLTTIREALALTQGEIIRVNIPVGTVDPEGIYQIEKYLKGNGFPELERYNWCWDWITKGGEWKGTLPKRISSFYYKRHEIKIVPEVLSQIGNIAMKHVAQSTTYYVDFTDHIDWQDGAFGDYGSCFWHSRPYAKKMIQDARLYAMRFWSDKEVPEIARSMTAGMRQLADEGDIRRGYGNTRIEKNGLRSYGRVWLIPDYLGDMSAVLFNTYPPGLGTITSARVLATISGLSYRQFDAVSEQDDLWINAGKCYLVGSSELIKNADRIGEVNIDLLALKMVRCEVCQEIGNTRPILTRSELSNQEIEVCSACLTGYSKCDRCGYFVGQEEIHVGCEIQQYRLEIARRETLDVLFLDKYPFATNLCPICARETYKECRICHQKYQFDFASFWDAPDVWVLVETKAELWFNRLCPDCYLSENRISMLDANRFERTATLRRSYMIDYQGELIREQKEEIPTQPA